MDIAEIRRKAKELKAREEAESAGLTAAKDAEQVSSSEETPLSDELLAAAGDDFIIDDDGAAVVTGDEGMAGEGEVFELPSPAESVAESGVDDQEFIDDIVEDPPSFDMEGASDSEASEELPQDEETSNIFVDEDKDIEDSVDSIIIPDEPSRGESSEGESSEAEPLKEEASEPPSSVQAQDEEVVEDEDEDAICLEAITFMLDDEEYGIDMDGIKEVIKPRELTNVPRAPDNIMGVLSLRGLVVPVMDLRRRLGMGYDKEGERIIIVRDGDEQLGLVVDVIVGAVSLTRRSIEPPPSFSTIDGELINAICRYDGESFILLNIGRILEKS